MIRPNTTVIIVVLIIVAAAAFFGYALVFKGQSGETTARSTVTAFGTQLNTVSLLAPEASSTIALQYGPYVTAQLLAAWEADPQHAPGRLTSSPWPDRIEVLSMTPQGSSYIVQGAIILMTSNEVEHGGTAGFIPVMLQVVPENGKWLIAAYQEQATSAPSR